MSAKTFYEIIAPEMLEELKRMAKKEDVKKFNPNHDRLGRFASGSSIGGGAESKRGVSPKIREEMDSAKITDLKLNKTEDNKLFSDSLLEATKSNSHGGFVDVQTADDVKSYKKFLSDDRMAGVAVKEDGDITCVFKNSNSQVKGAVTDLIITARENGGTKMDCYGEALVKMYEKCGYRAVAKVEFNPEYATDKLLLKEKPYVYVLAKTSLSTKEVINNIKTGKTKLSTSEELRNLKTFGKDGYEDALNYRDNLIGIVKNYKIRKKTMETGEKEQKEIMNLYKELENKYKDNEWALDVINDFKKDNTSDLKSVKSLVWTLDVYA